MFVVPNNERKGDYYVNLCYTIEKRTLILKMVEKDVFFCKQSLDIIYPNEENAFTMTNHERKGDYFVNPCLSKLTNEH